MPLSIRRLKRSEHGEFKLDLINWACHFDGFIWFRIKSRTRNKVFELNQNSKTRNKVYHLRYVQLSLKWSIKWCFLTLFLLTRFARLHQLGRCRSATLGHDVDWLANGVVRRFRVFNWRQILLGQLMPVFNPLVGEDLLGARALGRVEMEHLEEEILF